MTLKHPPKHSIRHTGRAVAGLVLAILLLVACGDPAPVPAPEKAVRSVTIQGDNHTVEAGSTLTLEVAVETTGDASKAVAWSSSEKDFATITEAGVITGVAAGTTIITATSVEDASKHHAIMVEVTKPFTIVVDTDAGDGSTEFQLGLGGEGTITVNWGDGQIEDFVDPENTEVRHDYEEHGTYTITVHGHLDSGSFGPSSTGNRRANGEAITRLESWGDLGITNLRLAFVKAENLITVPNSLPPGTTNIAGIFDGATVFNADISGWDTSSVENMMSAFSGASSFNQDITGWDTSSVTDMSTMFRDASRFSQPIGGWDTSNVTNMGYMFNGASSFKQDIDDWDTGNVTTMTAMFKAAASFNEDTGGWDTGNVTSLSEMFNGASSFNQDIGGWDTGNVLYTRAMFQDAENFNQDIGNWVTSSVTNMSRMFQGAENFDQDIASWDTSNATNMFSMFDGATGFNHDLSSWCVEKIETEPTAFADHLAGHLKPVWGTCPG